MSPSVEHPPPGLEEASLILERYDGSDSLDTIREHYRVREFVDGSYVDTDTFGCPYPGCTFTHQEPVAMWQHVHLSGAHQSWWPDGVTTLAAAVRFARRLADEDGSLAS